MNYISHLHVANTVYPNSEVAFQFGAMLPDYISIMGTKFESQNINGTVREGFNFHYQTDSVFDSLSDFTQLKVALRDDLDNNFEKSSKRAIADIGTEILLDGEVLRWPGVSRGYAEVICWSQENMHFLGKLTLLGNVFVNHFNNYVRKSTPSRYSNPEEVAKVLYRRLSQRPKLAFDENKIDVLSEKLSVHQKLVEKIAKSLVDQTINGLKVDNS